MSIHIQGELEIDTERGVIYFHSRETGTTVLRICQLPPVPPMDNSNLSNVDITYGYGVSWQMEDSGTYSLKPIP